MRRSHLGIGGWRNENSRTFRPRIGGNPHFRPARIYETLERPRFPPPGSRSIRLQHFNVRSEKSSDRTSDHSDKYRYRSNQNHAYQRSQQDHQRQPPMGQWSRHRSDSHRNTSKESFNYYEDLNADRFHINSMGDVDHRQIQQARGIYRPPLISPWADQPLQHPTEKNFNTSYRQDRSQNKQPGVSIEYTGHRPPASDHYGCNPTAGIENSHSFSRSVDDTVDIVRKRLLNRDRQNSTENFDNCQNNTVDDNQKIETITNFQSNRNEVPTRKKSHRQHLTDTTNCAKIKNKIVHQLFKMDKEKIHKLMDNPNSSSKFEYAISSLITESQNSFNRHLRSAAEKSLCDSSTEFIENDNNTIYEDTFMKQMQCILDPQDTVFLEDIKPFVMAELTKVLQLNEYGQYNRGDGEGTTSDRPEEQLNYIPYPNDFYDQEDIAPVNNYLVPHNILQTDYPRSKSVEPTIDNYEAYEDNQSHYEESKPLFERRCRTKSFNFTPNISNSETPFYGRNAESKPIEDFTRTEGTQDLFDTNAEQFSEEEDPFAELDKQYHVAVDPDFIDHDDISSPKQEINMYNSNYTKDFKAEPLSPENIFERTSDKDSDAQLQDTIKSSLNISSSSHNISVFKKESKDTIIQCKQEQLSSTLFLPLEENNGMGINNANENIEKQSESKEVIKQIAKTDNSTSPKTTSSNSRKRSIDQRPSHRKEKRKKADPNASESSKQILNKNIIINVNDCASKTSEKCEASKSIFNLFFSKEETRPVPKDNKNSSLNDKNHVEKHVKRKETPKKSSQKDIKIKRKDSISSNQPTSPTDNNNISNNDETPTKSDMKITLKPIDMFVEQPKKVNIHQAHRNTAPILTPNIEINKKSKVKGPLSQQTLKRHVAVQVIRKVHAKQTQTPVSKCCGVQSCLSTQKKYAVKAVQTDVNIPEKTGNKSNDAFERMKEIDLEIQVLLQEKFKLYSSIENKETGTNSMQTLGMTVLNVSPYNGEGENESTEDMLSEDAIVNDFANIPVEELEQLALESVEGHEVNNETTSSDKKRNLRRKVSCQDSTTKSPVTVPKKKNLKTKSPNISLIEQIIEDDRPLEDIISLDDLEIPETKTKKRKQRPKQITKKKAKSKSKAALSSSIDYKIKECSVIIVRTDINQYLKPTLDVKPDHDTHIQDENFVDDESSQSSQRDVTFTVDVIFEKNEENIVEETVVDDIQFDMLDVSEDIVVGESCEIKSLEDKEVIENVCEPVSEEIILDNSQSSIEEACTPAVGQCDECKVYDYAADENLRRDSVVVSGNADAVLAIECVENNFLAACLDGNVYYFNGDGQLLTTLRGSNLAVTCLTIVKEKYGITVYTGSLDSRIRYYDLETGLEKGPECNVLSPIQTMDRAWDTVFVGTRTGFVLQFECKNNMLIPVSSVKFSDQSILALRAMKEGPRKVLLVAARSENVTIKDAQTGLLLRTLVGPKMTVYTLLYEDGKVYCGTSSHQIHVFDYTSGSHVGTHEGGKGAVCLRATGGLLFAGCYDGCVYVYREGEGQPFAQIRGPSLMLLSLAVVGSKIIAGYKDRSLYIWKIPLCILQEMIL